MSSRLLILCLLSLIAFPLLTTLLAEQCAIAAQLDAEFSAASAVRAALTAKLAEVRKLPASLLRTAFAPVSNVL